MEENSPQNTVPPQTVTPAPRKGMSLFIKIIIAIFGVVCLFGVLKVTLQHVYPTDQTKDSKIIQSANWKTYTNKKYNFAVNYPDYLKFSETPYSTAFVMKQNQSGSTGFPTFYISVIPDGFNNDKEVYHFMSEEIVDKLYSINDNANLQIGPDAEFWTFKKLASIPVSGIDGVLIQNNNVLQGNGLVNRRIVVKKSGFTYIIGNYFKSQQELDDFYKFLVSFKFLR